MLIEHLIDFARIDVFTGANDHVALAIDDEEVTVLVSIPNIASVKPTVTKRTLSRFGIFEIALENIVATQDDFTQFVFGDLLVIIIDNFHFIADWQAARSWPPIFIRRIESRSASRLG